MGKKVLQNILKKILAKKYMAVLYCCFFHGLMKPLKSKSKKFNIRENISSKISNSFISEHICIWYLNLIVNQNCGHEISKLLFLITKAQNDHRYLFFSVLDNGTYLMTFWCKKSTPPLFSTNWFNSRFYWKSETFFCKLNSAPNIQSPYQLKTVFMMN